MELSVCEKVEIKEDFKQKTEDKGGSVLPAEATLPVATYITNSRYRHHECDVDTASGRFINWTQTKVIGFSIFSMNVKIDCRKYIWPPPRSRCCICPLLLMATLDFSGEELLFWSTIPRPSSSSSSTYAFLFGVGYKEAIDFVWDSRTHHWKYCSFTR